MTSMTYGRRAGANRFMGDGLETANPTTLLVMMYERLHLDLQRAEQAQEAGDRDTAHTNLVHAQAIVQELQVNLNLEVWDGAKNLSALYTWLLKELVTANVSSDVARTRACRVDIVEPLVEAWQQAAAEGTGAPTQSSGDGLA
ncbi:flagellar export chaperone FliS [Kineococcus sp. GCM10028916]|uniref:flagellar export chaperone FliS n=1 Tax=Kineococcus sp. GCM10028916 TaxID=3273394 RepID=UPI00363170DC